MSESIISSANSLKLVNSSDLETSDWELRMARLVGLEENKPSNHPPTSETEAEIDESNSASVTSSSPQQLQTQQSLSANPFAKLALVSAATLSVILVAGVFLSQLMGLGNNKSNKNNTTISKLQPQTINTTRPQNLASEVEALKTKLALTEQAETLKAAQQKLRNPQLNTSQTTPVVDSQVSPTNTTNRVRFPVQRQPIQTAYNPNSVRVIRDVSPQPTPNIKTPQNTTATNNVVPKVSTPFTPPQTTNQPITQPVIPVTPKPTPDPLQEWMKLAKLGSYGQVSISDNQGGNSMSSKPVNNPQNNAQIPTQPNNTTSNQTPPNQTPTTAASQNQSQSPKSVAVGTSVKAVLATAVFGETTRSSSRDKEDTDKTVFVLRLKQPLKSIDNAIALPEKTEFLAEIRSISEQGLIQLNITKVILPNNNSPIEKTLPQNSMIIRAPKGRPLIANQYPNRGGSIASMDAGLFVLGGLGKAAELANRTDSQVVTTNAGGTVISNSNPKRNIVAGILEGGMNTVVPQIAQRNQQAISQLSQKTNIWFLPAGKEIEIYVNQSMQF
jgi:Bacterial conjugation TrbI-like protein